MIDTSGHHIVYGTLRDVLTGEELPDTDDERIRQQLTRWLLDAKGYLPGDLAPRLAIATEVNGQRVSSLIELTVTLNGQRLLIIRYGPGSLVTRERPAIAAARLLELEYRIPLAAVTNGRDAELLDTRDGRVLATGMAAIPGRESLADMASCLVFEPFVGTERRDREARILNAFDVEVCCHGAKCALPPGGKDPN